MALKTHLTIGEVAETFNVPAWKVRRVVNRGSRVEVQKEIQRAPQTREEETRLRVTIKLDTGRISVL